MSVDRLDDALATVLAQQGRADTKAGLILTVDGILVAGLAALGSRLSTPAAIVAILGAVAVIASATLAVLVMRPRLGGDARGGYLHWATLADDDAVTEALTEDHRATHLRVMSAITAAKMQLLQRASDSTLLALALLAVAALVAAF